MTWPGGNDDGRGGQPPQQPYQGSYPTSPFQQSTPDQAGAYGGPEYDPAQYGSQLDPNQYGSGQYQQPTGYQQPGQYPQPGGYQQPAAYPQYGPYQPAGAPGPPYGPPPPKSRTGLVVGLLIVGLVVVLGVAAGVYLLNRDRTDQVAGPGASTTAAPTSSPATTSRPPLTSAGSAKPEAQVPGWQVAVSGKRKLAYDVPPDWKLADEDTIIGFEDAEGPKVGMSGAATYQDGYCAESDTAWRGATGLSGYKDSDLDIVAVDAATKWGRYGYLGPNDEQPQVSVGAAAQLTINGMKASHAVATVTVTVPAPCAPPSATVHAVAVSAPDGGSYVFLAISDQGIPDALTEDQLNKIIATIRTTN